MWLVLVITSLVLVSAGGDQEFPSVASGPVFAFQDSGGICSLATYNVCLVTEEGIEKADDSTVSAGAPDLAVWNDKIYVVWHDAREGDWDIYMREKRGDEWSESQKINKGRCGRGEDQNFPSITVHKGKVVIAWQSEGVICISSSGETTELGRGFAPSLASDGEFVYLVSVDRSGKYVTFAKSPDALSWSSPVTMWEGSFPSVAAGEGKIWVAWEKDGEIFLAKHEGAWGEPEKVIVGEHPDIALTGRTLYLVFEAEGVGKDILYLTKPPILELDEGEGNPDYALSVSSDEIGIPLLHISLEGDEINLKSLKVHSYGSGDKNALSIRVYLDDGDGLLSESDEFLTSASFGDDGYAVFPLNMTVSAKIHLLFVGDLDDAKGSFSVSISPEDISVEEGEVRGKSVTGATLIVSANGEPVKIKPTLKFTASEILSGNFAEYVKIKILPFKIINPSFQSIYVESLTIFTYGVGAQVYLVVDLDGDGEVDEGEPELKVEVNEAKVERWVPGGGTLSFILMAKFGDVSSGEFQAEVKGISATPEPEIQGLPLKSGKFKYGPLVTVMRKYLEDIEQDIFSETVMLSANLLAVGDDVMIYGIKISAEGTGDDTTIPYVVLEFNDNVTSASRFTVDNGTLKFGETFVLEKGEISRLEIIYSPSIRKYWQVGLIALAGMILLRFRLVLTLAILLVCAGEKGTGKGYPRTFSLSLVEIRGLGKTSKLDADVIGIPVKGRTLKVYSTLR